MLRVLACGTVWLGFLAYVPAGELGSRLVVKSSCDTLRTKIPKAVGSDEVDDCVQMVIAHIRPTHLADSQSHLVDVVATESLAAGSITIRPGWPRTFFDQIPQTIAVADFGNRGGLATILQDKEGIVHALAPDGVPLIGWPVNLVRTGTSNMPSAADLDEDGRDEVILGMRDMIVLSAKGKLLPGWPFVLPPNTGFGSPSSIGVRFFSDQTMRIAAGASRAQLFLFDLDGVPVEGWPVTMPSIQVPNPRVGNLAVGDVTGDGIPEVVATERSESRIFVYDDLGNIIPPFPVQVGRFLQEPTLGDLDLDGAMEIVLQTDRTSLGSPGVIITKGDGTPLPGWPQPTGPVGNWGVALGDVDGDGRLEVLASTVNGGVDFAGGVHLWNDDGSVVPGWPKFFKDVSFPNPVTMGDVDGDGVGDVIVGGLTAVLPSDGVIFAWKGSGELIPGFPIVIPGRPLGFSAPTVTDLDGDGIADLGVMTRPGIFGTFPATVYWFDLGVPYRPEGMEWPTRAHDMARTGAYSPPVRLAEITVRLAPPVMKVGTPAPHLSVLLSFPKGENARPQELHLTAVNGIPVAPVDGVLLASSHNNRARTLAFHFDAEAVRELLDGPGLHRLTFRTEVVSQIRGVQFQAEGKLTLR